MARVKKAAVEKATDTRASVDVRAFDDARLLVTIDADDRRWKQKSPKLEFQTGSIVRLRPPADTPPEIVQAMRDACAREGASKVVVLPTPRTNVVPQKIATANGGTIKPRAAVESLVAASTTNDRDALSALCQRVMSEKGL
jgi:hypothetical protein